LTIDLHTFFKLSAARRQDFHEVQLDLELQEEFFVQHIPTRWPTFGLAVERILRQWPFVNTCHLCRKKTDKQQTQSGAFRRMAAKCLNKELVGQMHFLDETIHLFEECATFFQLQKPKTHALYSMSFQLMQEFLFRFLKPALLIDKSGKKDYKDIDVNAVANRLSDDDTVSGNK
jgi:hypothetical protein